MKPVMQTVKGVGGDCFRACLASILEVGAEDLPHIFHASRAGDVWKQWQWEAVCSLAAQHGLSAHWLDPDQCPDLPLIGQLKCSGLHYIATGKSHGGDFGHCVVGLGNDMVHDPGGNRFLASDPWLYVFFVPITS
jgi:hypothetical protein